MADTGDTGDVSNRPGENRLNTNALAMVGEDSDRFADRDDSAEVSVDHDDAIRSDSRMRLLLVALASVSFCVVALGCGQDAATCVSDCTLVGEPGQQANVQTTNPSSAAMYTSCSDTCEADQVTATANGNAANFQLLLTCIGNAQSASPLCLPLACGLTTAFGSATTCGTLPPGSGTGSSTVGTSRSASTNSVSSSTFNSSTDSSSTFASTGTSSSSASSSSTGPENAGGGSCSAPEGGLAATPGVITCGNATCNASFTVCCEPSVGDGGAAVCQAPWGACPGTTIACNEASDCPNGEACCTGSAGTTFTTVSCQPLNDGRCPMAPVLTAQVCRCDSECASGSCNFWNCLGTVVEACSNPAPTIVGICTKM